VSGERLVPEALQTAEVVAVGRPLELGRLFARDQVDRIGVRVDELGEQVEQRDVASDSAPLRRVEPHRHAARISA
jgi:hypothetical protein